MLGNKRTRQERSVSIVFDVTIGAVLATTCDLESDSAIIHLTYVAQIIRRHMFVEVKPFNELPDHCPPYEHG